MRRSHVLVLVIALGAAGVVRAADVRFRIE